MKTVQTNRGTTLPLTNLKGKDYLMVAYRIQWFNEEIPEFSINTEFLLVTDEQTIARAKVEILKDNKVVKCVTATKRETKKDFSDHTEKAETSAIGRALALLGFGTQFAISDLDEGQRIVDSPVTNISKSSNNVVQLSPVSAATESKTSVVETKTTFKRQPKTETKPVTTQSTIGSEWES